MIANGYTSAHTAANVSAILTFRLLCIAANLGMAGTSAAAAGSTHGGEVRNAAYFCSAKLTWACQVY